MNEDDVVASIPCSIISKNLSIDLKLSEQYYLILLPKSLLVKHGVSSDDLLFDLVIKNQIVSLLGCKSKTVKQLPGKEVVTWVMIKR